MRDRLLTSIVIATGPHVPVKTSIDLSFIQVTVTRAIIDFSDNVANLYALDAPPFPIKYRRATVHIPVIKEVADCPAHLATIEAEIIQDIKRLKAYVSTIDVVMDKNSIDRHVSFGSSPEKRFPALPPVSPNGLVESPMEYYSVSGMGPGNNQ